MSEQIAVDVWSDVACPWCFVGKRKLENGIAAFNAAHPDVAVNVTYHSYQLDPSMPEDFEGGQAKYLSEVKGLAPDRLAAMNQRLTDIAAGVGLKYDMPGVQMTNTALAHQLLQYAKTVGLQVPMKERLMQAHFEEGKHVGRVDDLVALAVEVGLDADGTRAALESGEFKAAFQADVAQAQEYGINGVPFFVIQNKYGIEGAQNAEVFEHAFNTVLGELTGAGDSGDSVTSPDTAN
jgi:predicted DsbA family dithiol-disulfide isomerase